MMDASPVIIATLGAHDRAAWDDYVHGHPDGSVFHLSAWQSIIEQGLKHKTHFLCAKHGARMVGVLPLAETKSWLFGHHLSSLPFCMYGGPLADNQHITELLLSHSVELAHTKQVEAIEFRAAVPNHKDWPAKDLYVTFKKDLHQDHQENLNSIPRKQRAMVRKAMAFGLTSSIDTQWEEFLFCYDTSVRNLGTPAFPRAYFNALKEHLGEYIDVLTIRKETAPIAAVLSFYYKGEVLPFYGGGTERARALAANDFMYWALMEHAVNKGMSRFDFGRSKRGTGAFAFKKNWGFEPTPLLYQYCLIKASSVPQVNPNNPKYALMIKVWRRLPLFVHRVLGPPLSRYLG